jgi:TetR/AcrR family transcriptional regulator, transcriptional repressor of aconitase
MPKISAERRAERREQILAGARRCFAESGYEGATVARLEEAIGLSRGAIFNYFGSKEDLFVELVAQDSERLSLVWANDGLEAVVREVVELDPEWLSVYLELVRRVRTDSEFKRRIEERQDQVVPVNRARVTNAQRSGEFRSDIDAKDLGRFVNLVLKGFARQRASGDEPPPVALVVRLLEDAIGGRARSRTPSRTRASPA